MITNSKKNIIICLCILLYTLQSCNVYKNINKGQYLVVKNTIYVNDKLTTDVNLNEFIIQKPNNKISDLPFLRHILDFPIYLGIYNIADKNHNQSFKDWKKNNPKTLKILEFLFSKKGIKKMEKKYNNYNDLLLNSIGEAPVIYNYNLTQNSAKQLQRYFNNKGYFNAEVYTEHKLKNKQAYITYHINTKSQYHIDKIYTNIESPKIKSLYQKYQSLIQPKSPINIPLINEDSKKLTQFFKDHGLYNFKKEFITFQIDTTKTKNFADLYINIKNIYNTKDSLAFKTYKFGSVFIHLNNSFKNKFILDSVAKKNYHIYNYDTIIQYKKDFLINSIFIEPHHLYNTQSLKQTYNYLSSLGNFKNINIQYHKKKNNILDTHIYLSSLKNHSIHFDTDATNSSYLGLGFSHKSSYTDRNLFHKFEILKLSLKITVGNTKSITREPNKIFNAWEIGGKAKLQFPYFLIPFVSPYYFSKSKKPKTVFSLGVSQQKNIGLGRVSFNSRFGYHWNESKDKIHSLTLFNSQLIKNLDSENYYSRFTYQKKKKDDIIKLYKKYNLGSKKISEEKIISLIKTDRLFQNNNINLYKKFITMLNNKERITKNILINTSEYSFTYNDSKIFFNANLELAGNLFYLMDKLLKLSEGKKKQNRIFNVEYAQYCKINLEWKKYWQIYNTTLIFRSFVGKSFVYGNSKQLPFVKSYFAGGSNDVRAWHAYDLGTGGTLNSDKTINDYYVGDTKLLLNLEYRFNFFNKLKGALFIDAGNIWLADKNNPLSNFKFHSFYKQIAIGSGFGLRYDTNFFVFRIDIATKIYNPALKDNNWEINNFNIDNAIFHFGIGYPF